MGNAVSAPGFPILSPVHCAAQLNATTRPLLPFTKPRFLHMLAFNITIHPTLNITGSTWSLRERKRCKAALPTASLWHYSCAVYLCQYTWPTPTEHRHY